MKPWICRLICLFVFALPSLWARASESTGWMKELGAVPVQEGGRVMPLDTYARRLAFQLTGREHWGAGRGPEIYSGRDHMALLGDILFGGKAMLDKPLLGIENKPFKRLVGMEEDRKFFSANEVASNRGINDILAAYQKKRAVDSQVRASNDERRAMDLFEAANRLASLNGGEALPIVPPKSGNAYLQAGVGGASPGAEGVQAAMKSLAKAYAAGAGIEPAVAELRRAIDAVGQPKESERRSVALELFYNRHSPWTNTQVAYGLAMVLFALSRLAWRRGLVIAAVLATGAGMAEHLLGIGLRMAILERAPVSNTFESLLWMGLVGIVVCAVAQAFNRKSMYLFGGVSAAFISVIFAGMVPLVDRTNSLPAVLRSNYWLTVHVLTVVASYGVFAVAAVLGHVYLAREVLLKRAGGAEAARRLSHPILAQAYRTIQIGLLLLTAGTILGGVWAADSWGRFWGWDPKETWALISIVVYFALLHARYIGWLRDFGLAASTIIGFIVIVWTFYGVNYVMASGLHSYGFGSGGEVWVGLWAGLELAFLGACWLRQRTLERHAPRGPNTQDRPANTPPARPAMQG
jgi:cytochrome c-type biogenesis protein CcsB